MLLQTNSYVVPKQQRAEHARLLVRFRKALARIGCDLFEVYQQADVNWNSNDSEGRFVQILRFRNREHQQAVRAAERLDLEAQSLIEEFCRLINFPYQQEHGLFAVGFYTELKTEPLPVSGSASSAIDSGAAVGDPDLARVLDAGLVFDDLDVPMEAELLDEPESDDVENPVATSNPADRRNR